MADSQPVWPPRTFERIFSVLGILVGLLLFLLFVGSIPWILIVAVGLVVLALRFLPMYLVTRARTIFWRHFGRDGSARSEASPATQGARGTRLGE
jgi:hypothetical protein